MDEDLINKKAMERQSKMMESIYSPEDSEDTKRFKRKQELQKELSEIDLYEHRHDKKIEEMKKARLRKEVEKHMREQRRINFAVNQRFEQNDLSQSSDTSLGS